MQTRFPARPAPQSRRRPAPTQADRPALEPLESRTHLSAASPEFQVNTHTRDHQRFPAIAADADGDYVVTWESYQQEAPDWNIYAQRYAADGTPRGGEFRVNQDTGIYNTHSAVGMDDAGNFVVSWTQGPAGHVHARQFNADGSPVGDEFIVDWRPGAGTSSVAVDAAGYFVVAWDIAVTGDRRDVFAQKYYPRGGRFGIVQVNTNVTGSAWKADVAMDGDGDFAVAFEVGEDAVLGGTYVRKYDAIGIALLPETRVAAGPAGSAAPAVAMGDDGGYVVAWGGADGLKARRFHAFGVADGGDVLVAAATPPQALDVTAAPNQDFVVTWSATAADGFPDVYGRGYTAAGAAMGNAFRLNSTTISQQTHPTAAVDASGRFVAAWDSWGQDGDLTGVFGRHFADASGPPMTVVGRRVFYNNSAFDGASPLANLADDGAVPWMKIALLPGGTASFLNVTSYTRGINGVMVDVADLPEGVAPRVDDFSFRSRSAAAGSAWAAGPTPWRVSTRLLSPGRHRVTMLWRDYNPHDGVAGADEAVANGWLEVTVKANERMRLAAPEVFSFGNLVGKTGNGGPTGTMAVIASDVDRVRSAQGTTASANNSFDFNRDGRVNVLDLGTVRSRLGTSLPLLTMQRLSLGVAPTATETLTPTGRSSYVAQVLS